MADFPQKPNSSPNPVYSTITNVYKGDGTTTSYNLTMYATSIVRIIIDDVEVFNYTVTNDRYNNYSTVIFDSAPSNGSEIVIVYLFEIPQNANGYAKLATEEDIEADESGITYPNLHRRIDDSLGLYTFRVIVLGLPILTDEYGNPQLIPDIEISKELIHSLVTNSYDVQIIQDGNNVSDYIVDFITGEVKFMWVIRSADIELTFAEGYDLVKVADEVYRGNDKIIQDDTEEYQMSAKLEVYIPEEKDTYTLLTSTYSSFRTTEHHTHNENSNSEIP